MKKQFLGPLQLVALASAMMAVAPTARASEDDWDGLILALYSYTTIYPTIFPTLVSGEATRATANRGENSAMPAKELVLRKASVEAAEYLAGGEAGPFLSALADANPARSLDQIVDIVLDAAESL